MERKQEINTPSHRPSSRFDFSLVRFLRYDDDVPPPQKKGGGGSGGWGVIFFADQGTRKRSPAPGKGGGGGLEEREWRCEVVKAVRAVSSSQKKADVLFRQFISRRVYVTSVFCFLREKKGGQGAGEGKLCSFSSFSFSPSNLNLRKGTWGENKARIVSSPKDYPYYLLSDLI